MLNTINGGITAELTASLIDSNFEILRRQHNANLILLKNLDIQAGLTSGTDYTINSIPVIFAEQDTLNSADLNTCFEAFKFSLISNRGTLIPTNLRTFYANTKLNPDDLNYNFKHIGRIIDEYYISVQEAYDEHGITFPTLPSGKPIVPIFCTYLVKEDDSLNNVAVYVNGSGSISWGNTGTTSLVPFTAGSLANTYSYADLPADSFDEDLGGKVAVVLIYPSGDIQNIDFRAVHPDTVLPYNTGWLSINIPTNRTYATGQSTVGAVNVNTFNVGSININENGILGIAGGIVQETTLTDVQNGNLISFNYNGNNYNTDYKGMFANLTNCISINFDSDATLVTATDFSYMFYNDTSLTKINTFAHSYAVNMQGMCYNCNSLVAVHGMHRQTFDVTNFNYTFANCTELRYFPAYSNDITGYSCIDFQKVDTAQFMFASCTSLVYLGFEDFLPNPAVPRDLSYMFYNCSSLVTFDYTFAVGISNPIGLSVDGEAEGTVAGCVSLINGVFENKGTYIDYNGLPLDRNALLDIFNNLADLTEV